MHNSLVGKYALYLIPLITSVSILFFMPTTLNFYTVSKILILIFSIGILIVAWGYSSYSKRTIEHSKSLLNLPLLLFSVFIILNFVVNREGWLEAVTGRGILYIVGAILAYFAAMTSSEKLIRWFLYSFIGSSSLLAIHSLLQLTVLNKLDSLPSYMSSRAFTPTGSTFTTLSILIIGAITTFTFASRYLKSTYQYTGFILGTLQTIAAVAYISLMLPGMELAPELLPYQASWSVTLDALKSGKSILFGIGLANFTSLYTSVKPLYLNAGSLWNAFPPSATSEVLHLLATTGVLGLGSFLLILVVGLTRRLKNSELDNVLFVLFLLCTLALIFTPANIPLVILFFLSTGLLVSGHDHTSHISNAVGLVMLLLCSAVALTVGIFAGRAYAAENHMYRAQQALLKGDGKAVYEQHVAAIGLMPAMTNYRLSYSQVNLSLASALSEKKDLTDSDRQQITTLVQQAIREGKIAASLRPHDSRTWQNLGNIYRNLINVADGADQFAVSAYSQAVTTNPADPSLRLEFGGLLYQLSGSDENKESKIALLSRAVQEFQTTIQLKPDYANAYYNLSKAYELAGNTDAAYAAMQKAVAALDPTSPDIGKATAELETLKGKLPKASASPSPSVKPSDTTELSQPSPLPSPLSGGLLDLPQESPLPSPTPAQ